MIEKNKMTDDELENVNGGHTDVWLAINERYYRVAAMPGGGTGRKAYCRKLAEQYRPAPGDNGYDYDYFKEQVLLNRGFNDATYVFDREPDGTLFYRQNRSL